ncbi:hypothetical protein [Croceicoccus sp. YJ47]|uniref:hypothetical protein n=1 Tax=Croceicoccus sp. YJ47 TaxID=2798724 RepID=UPI001923FD2A|nr:hypothetical protein [Croceicoccus sp. YJ47]QQN73909.1 hypothetical protein JD971_14360 [Croceicoccus sp. YJ47]
MTQEKLPVSQAARDAASDWCKSQPFPSKQAEGPMIREGSFDHHSLAQAFARFERETLGRAAKKAEGIGDVFGLDETNWFECAETIAAAIRALAPEAQHHD